MRLTGQIEERPCGMCDKTVRIKKHEDTICPRCGFVVKRAEPETEIVGYE